MMLFVRSLARPIGESRDHRLCALSLLPTPPTYACYRGIRQFSYNCLPGAVELVSGTGLEPAPGGIKESWRPQRDSNALDPSRWTHYGGGVMKMRTITYPTCGMLLLGLTRAGEVRLARVA